MAYQVGLLVFVCHLFASTAGDSFDDGWNNDIVGLTHSISVGANVKLLPLVHRLVNVDNINKGGNITISEIKTVVNNLGTNIDVLNNAKNGKVVFNDIQKLSNTVRGAKKLLASDSSAAKLCKIGPINVSMRKIYNILKAITNAFSGAVKFSAGERDLYLDTLLSGAMGLLYEAVKDVLGMSNVSKLSDRDSKIQLLSEVTFAKALANGFVQFRTLIARGTKYAQMSSNMDALKERDAELIRCKKLLIYDTHCTYGGSDKLSERVDQDDDDMAEAAEEGPSEPAYDVAQVKGRPKKKKLCLFVVLSLYCALQETSLK